LGHGSTSGGARLGNDEGFGGDDAAEVEGEEEIPGAEKIDEVGDNGGDDHPPGQLLLVGKPFDISGAVALDVVVANSFSPSLSMRFSFD
jgi:hypothetical protein